MGNKLLIPLATWHCAKPANKILKISPAGELVKELPKFTGGNVSIVEIEPTGDALVDYISALTENDYQTGGLPHDVGEFGSRGSGAAITRSSDCVDFNDGPGILTIDADWQVGGDELVEIIRAGLANIGLVMGGGAWYPSSGSGWTDTETGKDFGTTGCHLQLLIDNARQVPEVLEALHYSLWELGHGEIRLSADGKCLARNHVDVALRTPSQPIFSGRPTVHSRLTRDDSVVEVPGGLMDTSTLEYDSTPGEILVDLAKKDMAVAASKQREKWRAMHEAKAADGVRKRHPGASEDFVKAKAKQTVDNLAGGVLDSSFELLPGVTVADVLDNPGKYDQTYIHDPIEPEAGPGRAKIFGDVVYSWLHGGRQFRLGYSEMEAVARLGKYSKLSDLEGSELIETHNAMVRLIERTVGTSPALRRTAKAKGMSMPEYDELEPILPVGPAVEDDADVGVCGDDATHAQLAAAWLALEKTKGPLVAAEGQLWLPDAMGMWRGRDEVQVGVAVGMSRFDGMGLCCRRSDYNAIAGLVLGMATPEDDFFNIGGVVHGGRIWTADADGIHVRPLVPEDKQRVEFPHAPDDGPHPLLDRVMTDAFGSMTAPEVLVLQEMVGLMLIGRSHSVEKCLLLYGASRGGKGTFVDAVKAMLPLGATSSESPSTWDHEYSIAAMAGRRLNAVGELPSKKKMASDIFKAVIGGDEVAARVPYGQKYKAKIRGLHIFSTNQLPLLEEISDAFFSRFVMIEFKNSFIGKEDLSLKANIVKEAPQIMHWALQGAVRYHRQGGLTEIDMAPHRAAWRLEADVTARFWAECIGDFEVDPELPAYKSLKANPVYALFREYCHEVGSPPPSRHGFYSRCRTLEAAPPLADARGTLVFRGLVRHKTVSIATPSAPPVRWHK